MTNDGGGGEHARRRADEAGIRARELRDHVDAVRAGTEQPHGTTREALTAALERARQASERLTHALESSADAHDRAADAYDEQIRRHGDPDGRLASRSAVHRRDATLDRDRAHGSPA
jgi:hypothetical protein